MSDLVLCVIKQNDRQFLNVYDYVSIQLPVCYNRKAIMNIMQ